MNTLEFTVFEINNMSPLFIGLSMGAWGLGGLVAFGSVSFPRVLKISALSLAVTEAICLSAFTTSNDAWLMVVSLGVAGFANALLVGRLQTDIQHAIPQEIDDRSIWAALHQIMNALNLGFAAIFWFALSAIEHQRVAYSLVVASVAFAVLMFAFRDRLGSNKAR
ncbi:hypothetical protein [Bradyrhizobium sp. AZCC 1699]|uniref:hypothetical protein n=1 Tax=Bradyrhizobium sp. AZCC 1699 TaxID=3117024 RepID=UPI002FEEFD5F